MNFSQLHERLRLEIIRRIDRDLLSAASLARQTGLQQPHISNFLRSKRRLSLAAMDRVLASLALSVEDLLPQRELSAPPEHAPESVPFVSQTSAIHDALLTPNPAAERIQLPAGTLDDLRPRQTLRRPDWLRFVAVGVTPLQARPMEPRLSANNIIVLDRHYNSLADHHPPEPNIYGVRVENALLFRYVSFALNRLILRPHSLEFPVQLIEIEPHRSPADLIVGRVCVTIARF